MPLGAWRTVDRRRGPLHGEPLGPAAVGDAVVQPRSPASSIGTAVDACRRPRAQTLPVHASAPASRARPQAFQAAQQGLLVLLVLAILVIYLVLGILYESFIHPLTILSGLPFAGFGALLALMHLPAWT